MEGSGMTGNIGDQKQTATIIQFPVRLPEPQILVGPFEGSDWNRNVRINCIWAEIYGEGIRCAGLKLGDHVHVKLSAEQQVTIARETEKFVQSEYRYEGEPCQDDCTPDEIAEEVGKAISHAEEQFRQPLPHLREYLKEILDPRGEREPPDPRQLALFNVLPVQMTPPRSVNR
jgi:hypothetical protein